MKLLNEGLREAGLSERDLEKLAKGDLRKVTIAARIRQATAVPLAWIAERLRMGTASNVSKLCCGAEDSVKPSKISS